MRSLAAFIAAMLATPSALAAGGSELLWSQPDDTNMVELQSYALSGEFTLYFEAADDFDVAGAIGKVRVSGSFGIPSSLGAMTGATVRFYAWTAAGPGALLFQDTIASTEPEFGPGYALTLHQPFASTGKGFVSVQFLANAPALWTWSDSHYGAPTGSTAYMRTGASGAFTPAATVFGPAPMDLSFELWSPPILPPDLGSDPCGTWIEMSVPTAPTAASNATLLDVDALAPDDVWAVGYSVVPNPPQLPYAVPLAMHFDGSSWSVTPTPYSAQNPTVDDWVLQAVKAFGPDDVWAAGWKDMAHPIGGWYGPQLLAMHWDGARWSVAPTPIALMDLPGLSGGSGVQVNAIHGSGSNDVWFVGDWLQGTPQFTALDVALAMHWDGSAFTVVPTPYPGGTGGFGLDDVVAFAADDAWAVGGGHGNSYSKASYVLHWNGAQWSTVAAPTPGLNARWRRLAARGPSDIWASVEGNAASGGLYGAMMRYDGSTWSQAPAPETGSFDLYAAPSGTVYSIGIGVERFDGTSWSKVATLTANQQQVVHGRLAGIGECTLVAVAAKTVLNGFRPFAARVLPNLWTPLGGGVGGIGGPPVLAGAGAAAAGQPILLTLSQAAPFQLATLFLGGAAPLGVPAFGGTFWPQPLAFVAGLPTGASGGFSLWADWPASVPAGTGLILQTWLPDPSAPLGVAASGGLALESQ